MVRGYWGMVEDVILCDDIPEINPTQPNPPCRRNANTLSIDKIIYLP